MTVKELIEILSKISDKEVKLVIDCPYCGKSDEIATLGEVVILGGKKDDRT